MHIKITKQKTGEKIHLTDSFNNYICTLFWELANNSANATTTVAAANNNRNTIENKSSAMHNKNGWEESPS